MERSLFFEVMINCQFEEGNKFREQESNNELPLVELHQCSSKDILISILNFIYCEKIDLNEENFIEFLTLGELFGLSALVKQCDEVLFQTRFKGSELLELYKYALSCDKKSWITHLEKKSLEYVQRECMKNAMNGDEIYSELLELGANEKTLSKYVIKSSEVGQ